MWEIIKNELVYKKWQLLIFLALPMLLIVVGFLVNFPAVDLFLLTLCIGLITTITLSADTNRGRRLRIYGSMPLSLKTISIAQIMEFPILIMPITFIWLVAWASRTIGGQTFPFWSIITLNGFLFTSAYLLLAIPYVKYRIYTIQLLIIFVVILNIFFFFFLHEENMLGIIRNFIVSPYTAVGFNLLALGFAYLSHILFVRTSPLLQDASKPAFFTLSGTRR